MPAVALAEDAVDQDSEGAVSAQSARVSLVFMANGGQFADGNDFVLAEANEGESVDAPTPTRAGYTFKGWYSLRSMDGIPENLHQSYKLDPSSAKKGNWFAVWEKNAETDNPAVDQAFSAQFSANGGVFADGSAEQSSKADSNGIVTEPTAPTRAGYTFEGWYWHKDYTGYTDEQKELDKVDFSKPIQANVNMYAQWKAADVQAELITVKFVDNFNETESSTEVKKGEAVAKPADPSYDGWTFEGWSSTLKDDEGNWLYTPVDFSKAVEDEDQDGVVTYYAFYSENQAAADDADNGEEAAEQEPAGDDADATDESSIAPQTGDATNVATVAGVGGIAGLLAAAAALLRRRHNN